MSLLCEDILRGGELDGLDRIKYDMRRGRTLLAEILLAIFAFPTLPTEMYRVVKGGWWVQVGVQGGTGGRLY